MRVYITRKLHEAAENTLHQAGIDVEVNPEDRPLTQEEFAQAATHADAVICVLNEKINQELLDKVTRPRIFANYAVGYDNMDVAYATRKGIALTNTPGVLSAATAELAWALLFAVARHICEGDRMVREGRFHGWAPMMLLGYEVGGKTLGILGAGRIGCAMAQRAKGFDMRVLYTRPSGKSTAMEALGAQHVTLDELLEQSDFLSVHTPLTPASHHLLGARQFEQMKPSAIVINTARGPVIDEKALVEALKSGQIAGAGLDVYENEPQVEPELLQLSNVTLAPHIGSATYEARARMGELAALNILDLFAGRVPRNCINPGYLLHVNHT